MKKQWHILSPDRRSVESLCRRLACHPATAAVLVNRGICSFKEARHFLTTPLARLRQPFVIKDMQAAVQRISAAVVAGEKILIFGDYDVDGITATAILLEFFRALGTDVYYYIPHRIKEGYGFQARHVPDVAVQQNISLMITVDCGVQSHAAVEAAEAAGIDVVVTDHHVPPASLPRTVATVNPKRPDCTSGLNDLAGVGVAFYLLVGLRKQLRDMHFWQNRPEPNLKKDCDLVALGTLADMVPLREENRILSKTGLDIIRINPRPGIAAILRSAGIDQHSVNSDDVVFSLAPLLNAAGRMDYASAAVELLTTDHPATAEKIVQRLTSLNDRRRRIENRILDDVQTRLANEPDLLDKQTLVLYDRTWHEGVLGIVAARMVQMFFKPVILFNFTGQTGKGSARSVPGIDIVTALRVCRADLESFGGHSMAAGLKIKQKNVDRFQENIEKTVSQMARSADLIPKIFIDGPLDFDHISDVLIDELESLQPFGSENPDPIFMSTNLKVVRSEIVGQNHRRMRLKQASRFGRTFDAIHFNVPNETDSDHLQKRIKIAFRLRWNRWSGIKSPQIVIEDVLPDTG